MTARSETVPRWTLLAIVIALGANTLASAMTRITIDLMRSRTPFAEAVRLQDLRILPYYQAIAYAVATTAVLAYLWPIFAFFRCDAAQTAPPVVQRRALNAPAVVAGIGLLPWLLNIVVYPTATLLTFGAWKPELASQQMLSPVVNGFLAATTTYLLLDWLFRAMVLPRVFPAGRLVEVPGSWALGVRARLLIFLIAVAFVPLFTMLGLIRAAATRIGAGGDIATVVPALTHAGEVTFLVFVALGMAFTVILARTFTLPLTEIAQALRRLRRGDLTTRLQSTASDELGVLQDGVNAMAEGLQERERILQTFGRVVEPAVRDRLLAGDLRRGGEERFVTVLFADLRGFTALGERLPPGEVVAILNEYFSAVASWVRVEGGHVDKFIGDGILAVFGLFGDGDLPARRESAAAALRCALGLPARLAALNAARAASGAPPLALSIGLASGVVIAGTIGAEDRYEYTVIGDAVNVAARLQEAAKQRAHPLLATTVTRQLAADGGFASALQELEPVAVRGRSEPVDVVGIQNRGAAEG
ncbi:adenylate/guanylate cyclase domain-containing protein [bacterium]|nr:adenylate/guanylate cyclase domain-containing protein [bacterium]